MKKNVFIILILSLLLLFSLAQADKAPFIPVPAKSYEFKGALNIRIHPRENKLHPSGELFIVDPLGRKAGNDPRINKTYTEIPDSSYESESIADAETDAPGPETKIIDVQNPTDGEYILCVIGTESSSYDMEIRGYDCDVNHSHMNFLDIKISEGEEQKYTIKYSSKKGSKIEVIPVQRKLLFQPYLFQYPYL